MRSFGIDEKYITGDASWHDKFMAYAEMLPYAVGNPLYHWTHLELQRFFHIDTPLSPKTAEEIWSKANAMIAMGGFKPRDLIAKSNVACVFTTDDPADSLEYHKLIAEDKTFQTKVVPAFRPDKALGIELPAFIPWLKSLEERIGRKIETYTALEEALLERIAFFAEYGCKGSDHAFSYVPYAEATADEIEAIFQKGKKGETLTVLETDRYRTALLSTLAKEYARRAWAMELHIGPMRNNNKKMFEAIGPDTGFDSLDDREIAVPLSRFLDSLAYVDLLPKTILFTLNPKDNYVLGSMLGNFQNSDAPGKIQFGSGWWFNDNLDGMREQMKALGNLSILGKFVGMVTDSRSFLSYPRHEYFR
ncbi:MAG TPA: glucuronate isomerase, partial [Ruminococcaceae bacterium]|nr:glucuronate isomerase [Oscillospiraceae bacterium]